MVRIALEQEIVKKGKKEYIFSSDKIVVKKKGEVIQEISHDEIAEMSYNPKFGVKDFFVLFLVRISSIYSYKAFVIYLKPSGNFIEIKLSNEDFERIKSFFKMPIKIV